MKSQNARVLEDLLPDWQGYFCLITARVMGRDGWQVEEHADCYKPPHLPLWLLAKQRSGQTRLTSLRTKWAGIVLFAQGFGWSQNLAQDDRLA